MSAKVQTAQGAGHGGAGRSAGARRKRFCPRCKTRVSRSARRCGYCRQRLLNLSGLALKASAGVVLLLLVGRFLNLF